MKQDQLLTLLYRHLWGRMLLKPLVSPPFSKAAGWLMDSRASRLFIPYCIKKWQLPMEQYEKADYQSYNQFFSRQIRREARPFPEDKEALVSPCDGLVSVYPIRTFSRMILKQTCYTLEQLFESARLAQQYEGGTAVVFRLTVSHYHRYCYPVSGNKSVNRTLPGIFHTVNPIANDIYPIYKQNTRTYTRLSSPRYGNVVQMEVGALCVGRIVNYHQKAAVTRGQEKGRFEFGGSTIILFFEKDRVNLRKDLLEASAKGLEFPMQMGQPLEENT